MAQNNNGKIQEGSDQYPYPGTSHVYVTNLGHMTQNNNRNVRPCYLAHNPLPVSTQFLKQFWDLWPKTIMSICVSLPITRTSSVRV